ncbi:unknown [Alistipes sp. CAG:435]|nr:unknown [Alistipes sp. CAG:435]
MILPNIRSMALTDEISTSTTLLVFSSMTLDITCPPNIMMNIQMMMPRSMEMIMYIPDSETVSLPFSSIVYSVTLTSAFTSSIILERLSMPYCCTRYSSTASLAFAVSPEVNSTPSGSFEYVWTETVFLTESSGDTTTRTSFPYSSRRALTESGFSEE